MYKDSNQIERMLETTIPIDTWILEKIRFNKNGWNQVVPIGSKPVTFFDTTRCDRIEYYRDPSCSGNFIFEITYQEDYCLVMASFSDGDDDRGLKLEYARPDFFQRLESWIWNIRTIDYVLADLKAMKKNITHIVDGVLCDKESIAKRIGFLTDILEATGKLDMAVRNVAYRFSEAAHYPIVDGREIIDNTIIHEQDDIPF